MSYNPYSRSGNAQNTTFEKCISCASLQQRIKELEKENSYLKTQNANLMQHLVKVVVDLRNPVASIKGFTEILAKNWDTYDRNKVLNFIKIIDEAAEDAKQMISTLKNWTRLNPNAVSARTEHLDSNVAKVKRVAC